MNGSRNIRSPKLGINFKFFDNMPNIYNIRNFDDVLIAIFGTILIVVFTIPYVVIMVALFLIQCIFQLIGAIFNALNGFSIGKFISICVGLLIFLMFI